MVSISKPQSFRWLTTAVFLASSAVGVYVIQIHLSASSGDKALGKSQIHYSQTGVAAFDFLLDLLVTFFHYSLLPETPERTFSIAFWANISVWLALMELEGVRRGASWWMRFTIFWGLIYQTIGAGIVASVYYAVFLSKYPQPRSAGSVITPTGANAVFFGLAAGAAPTILAMFWIGGPRELAVFQFLPVYIWTLREVYMLASEKKTEPAAASMLKEKGDASSVTAPIVPDGCNDTLRVHLLVAYLSTYVHITFILVPILRHPTPLAYVKQLFIPSVSPPSPLLTTAVTAAHHFLQWDLIMIMTPAFFAGIWDFDLATRMKAIVWFVVASPLLSPGTALAGVWGYRERVMTEMRRRAQ